MKTSIFWHKDETFGEKYFKFFVREFAEQAKKLQDECMASIEIEEAVIDRNEGCWILMKSAQHQGSCLVLRRTRSITPGIVKKSCIQGKQTEL